MPYPPLPWLTLQELHTFSRSEEHTSELQSLTNLVCRLLLEKKKKTSVLKRLTNTHCCLSILRECLTTRICDILRCCSCHVSVLLQQVSKPSDDSHMRVDDT